MSFGNQMFICECKSIPLVNLEVNSNILCIKKPLRWMVEEVKKKVKIKLSNKENKNRKCIYTKILIIWNVYICFLILGIGSTPNSFLAISVLAFCLVCKKELWNKSLRLKQHNCMGIQTLYGKTAFMKRTL